MARTVLTARKTTGGKIPRKQLANRAAVKKKSASAKENQPQPSTPPRPTKEANIPKPTEQSPSGDEAFKKPRRKEAPIDLISKKIRKIRSYEELIYIAERLFQKDPTIVDELKEDVGDSVSHQMFLQVRSKLVSLIQLALDKKLKNSVGDVLSLPTDPENYLSYCELVEVAANSDTKNWYTFVLQNLNKDENFHTAEGEVPLINIRKLVKKRLSKDHETSVQMEIKALEDIELVMLRIATTNKTKNKEKDRFRLLTAKPTFLAYFPREDYFYANSANPNEEHCQALMASLKCTAYEGIPLNGKHLESLRQLRCHRDEPEEINHDIWADDNEDMPMLNTFSVSATNSIKENQETLVENISATIDLRGNDVLNSLRHLVSQSDIITDPLPAWVTKAVYRGRNHVIIKPRVKRLSTSAASKRNGGKRQSVSNFRDFDEMSLAGSDITVLSRRTTATRR